MQGHNRPEVTQALGQLLGVKGELTTLLEPTITPAVIAANLIDTPYLRYGIPVMADLSQAAGGAGEFSYVWAMAGPNTILQVKEIHITGLAAAFAAQLLLMSAANVTTVGAAAAINFRDLANMDDTWTPRGSVLQRGTHTSASTGTVVRSIQVPALTDQVIKLPDPGVFLMSSSVGLGVSRTDDDDPIEVSFYGKEWPRPG